MASIGEGATPLMYACQQAKEKDCLDILARKPKTAREKDRTHKTPLHYCAENLNTSCAEAVLRVAPDVVNARDEDGYSPLHLAVIAGNKPLIQLLLSKGADVNALDHEKHSVVHWATVCGEHEALEMVLRAGAKISSPDMHGGFPLHYAAQMCGPGADLRGDSRAGLSVLRTLLSFGADVDEQDKDGRQPILWAASADAQSRDPGARFRSSGSAEAILALVKAGAKVEAADKDGLTALHCAASRGHTDCLETLVALCGAHVDTIDVNGCTALFYAATLGHADATQLLLNLGAEPNRQDRKGRSPAHCGAAKGQLETLRLLLAGGANLWLRNVKGDLPLHEAVASGRRELVKWLLNQRSESVNVANNDGKCPIHVAAINNNVEIIKILLDSGSLVNPVLRSNKGGMLTPLDAALLRGHRSCAKFLQLHGGVPRIKLTDASAALRGTISRELLGTDRSIDGDLFTRLPTHPAALSVSPRFLDESPMQLRLNAEDVAIRHVERIEVPICEHRSRHIDGESSEEERRYRRRRRRRKSERRRQESFQEDDSNDDVSQDSNSRSRRKSGKGRSVSDGGRKLKTSVERSGSRRNRRDKGSEDTSEEESESSGLGKGTVSEEDSPESPPKKSSKKKPSKNDSGREDPKKSKKKAKSASEVAAEKGTKSRKNDGSKHNELSNSRSAGEEKAKILDISAEKPDAVVNRDASTPAAMEMPLDSQLKLVETSELVHLPDLEVPTFDPALSPQVLEVRFRTPEPESVSPGERNLSFLQPDSSLEDNDPTLPITVEVEAEVHRPVVLNDDGEKLGRLTLTSALLNDDEGSAEEVSGEVAETELPPSVKELVEMPHASDEQESASLIKPSMDVSIVPLDSTGQVSVSEVGSPSSRPMTARRRSVVQELTTAADRSVQEEGEATPDSKVTDIAFFNAEEIGVPGRRRSLTPADGSEGADVEEENSVKVRGGRRQSLVFGEPVAQEALVKRSRRRSEGAIGKSAMRSVLNKTESEERDELVLQAGDVDTVIKDVLLGEPELRSGSMGEDSGGSTRYEDSSALPDSGIEPSPRRERRERPSPSASPGRRIPRPCRKDHGGKSAVPVSVTRAVQSSIRKYHLERKIFYQLLELKRLQIRAGRANEQVLVKRLVDEYQRAGHVAGLAQYTGVYSFRQFERFLYDQLHTLQAGSNLVIPQLKPTDDIETLSAILKRTRAELQEGTLHNPMLCTHSTHRCPHAAHAYTGIPCAAYITKLNHHTMPKDKSGFLPRIDPALVGSRRGKCNARPDRPVTLEVIHGQDKQVISLPTDRLDRNKRYYVTFTIKGGVTPPQAVNPTSEGIVSHQHAKTV